MASETEEKTTQNWMKEAQKGYIRMGVLILLSRKPSHGYEIMKEINSRTKGFWQPTPGGVYPILRDLEKSRYIKGEWQTQKNRRLKVYKITNSGEQILRRAIIKQSEISNNIGSLFREFARDVLNIETSENFMPNMPSIFSAFLDEKGNSAETLKQLEHQRKHTFEALRNMRDRLKRIDERIREIKSQQAQMNPSQLLSDSKEA
jgi:PadR family transcriptional regulator, regulatory protein PadR